MSAGRKALRGFSLLEVLIAASILVLVVVILGQFLSASHSIVADTRVRIRTTAEMRRSLEAIVNVVRGIDPDTLTGFDENWESENPTYRRVVGTTLEEKLLGEVEELRWIASPTSVDGVVYPGTVCLVMNGEPRLLAARVPLGGFHIRQDGDILTVHLTTYFTTSARRTEFVSGRTAIHMRN